MSHLTSRYKTLTRHEVLHVHSFLLLPLTSQAYGSCREQDGWNERPSNTDPSHNVWPIVRKYCVFPENLQAVSVRASKTKQVLMVNLCCDPGCKQIILNIVSSYALCSKSGDSPTGDLRKLETEVRLVLTEIFSLGFRVNVAVRWTVRPLINHQLWLCSPGRIFVNYGYI